MTLQEFLDGVGHKKIYYFVSHHIRHSPEPHYFVCLGVDNGGVILMNCFTTQMNKKIEYVESRGLDTSTLVFVNPTTENGLTKDCGINCNDVYMHSKDEFEALFNSGDIRLKGELEDRYYAQVYQGVKNSDMVEEELKKKIKDID